MNRLSALVLLTAAFSPAAVLGALPVVAPVVMVVVAVGMVVAALEPPEVAEAVEHVEDPPAEPRQVSEPAAVPAVSVSSA